MTLAKPDVTFPYVLPGLFLCFWFWLFPMWMPVTGWFNTKGPRMGFFNCSFSCLSNIKWKPFLNIKLQSIYFIDTPLPTQGKVMHALDPRLNLNLFFSSASWELEVWKYVYPMASIIQVFNFLWYCLLSSRPFFFFPILGIKLRVLHVLVLSTTVLLAPS